MPSVSNVNQQLNRQLGLADAVMMGLGSIVGTGIFVSIGLAAGITGPSVVIAVGIAALVATCNALSSAQLAAAHPISGGTYEYGYRFLNPVSGFLAGWLFLLAKSASAAAAALGFASYMIATFKLDSISVNLLAASIVVGFTILVLSGIKRTKRANTVIVVFTILSLITFVVAASVYRLQSDHSNLIEQWFVGDSNGSRITNLLQATALMFVAYTGYGRIATMAEEVTNPRVTIPRAIIVTLVLSALLYILVSFAAVAAVGPEFLYKTVLSGAAPLTAALEQMHYPKLSWIIMAGAGTALLGVLLNLILGLSRVILAMGRRRDMPSALAQLDRRKDNPWLAVILIGLIISAMAYWGSVKTTWSFSAFTVLIYYAITNAAALALPPETRLFPKWISIAGLLSCAFLAFWVELQIWLLGCGLLIVGYLWFLAAEYVRKQQPIK